MRVKQLLFYQNDVSAISGNVETLAIPGNVVSVDIPVEGVSVDIPAEGVAIIFGSCCIGICIFKLRFFLLLFLQRKSKHGDNFRT